MELRDNYLILTNVNFTVANKLTMFLLKMFNPNQLNIIRAPTNIRIEDHKNYLRGVQIYLSVCYPITSETKLEELSELECYFTALVAYDWNERGILIYLASIYNRIDDGVYWFWLANDHRFWMVMKQEITRRRSYFATSQTRSTLTLLTLNQTSFDQLEQQFYLQRSRLIDSGNKLVTQDRKLYLKNTRLDEGIISSFVSSAIQIPGVVVTGSLLNPYDHIRIYYRNLYEMRFHEIQAIAGRTLADFVGYLKSNDINRTIQDIISKGYNLFINVNAFDLKAEIRKYLMIDPKIRLSVSFINNVPYLIKLEVISHILDVFVYGDVDYLNILNDINNLLRPRSYRSSEHNIVISDGRGFVCRINKIKFDVVEDILAYIDVGSDQLLQYKDGILATELYIDSYLSGKNLVIPSHQSSDYNRNLLSNQHYEYDFPSSMSNLNYNPISDPKQDQGTYRQLIVGFEKLPPDLEVKTESIFNLINTQYANDYQAHSLAFTKFWLYFGVTTPITNSLNFKYKSYFQGDQHYVYPKVKSAEYYVYQFLPKALTTLTNDYLGSKRSQLEQLEVEIEALSLSS